MHNPKLCPLWKRSQAYPPCAPTMLVIYQTHWGRTGHLTASVYPLGGGLLSNGFPPETVQQEMTRLAGLSSAQSGGDGLRNRSIDDAAMGNLNRGDHHAAGQSLLTEGRQIETAVT